MPEQDIFDVQGLQSFKLDLALALELALGMGNLLDLDLVKRDVDNGFGIVDNFGSLTLWRLFARTRQTDDAVHQESTLFIVFLAIFGSMP